jgi:hypothetical protein
MPVRIASLTKRISENGQLLHRAMMSRLEAHGADHEPSEDERALIEERKALKDERDRRRARAMAPKAKAADRLVRTHHAQPQNKAKPAKERTEAKGATSAKPHKSRAEKQAAKAAALDAARRAPKKTTK